MRIAATPVYRNLKFLMLAALLVPAGELNAQPCTSITVTNTYGLPGKFYFFILDGSGTAIVSDQFTLPTSNGSKNISLNGLLTTGATYTAELEPYGSSGFGEGFSNFVLTVSADLLFANGTNTFSGLVYAPASAEEQFTDIGSGNCVTVSPATLPPAEAGQAYLQTFSATGGLGPPYTWSISSGSLPPGFTLNSSSGVLTSSGSPAPTAQPYNFTVQAADSGGGVGQQAITLTVFKLQVTNASQPLAVGQCASINSSTATPTMPVLAASLVSSPPLATGSVAWSLNVTYTGPNGSKGPYTFSYTTPPASVPAGQTWTVPWGTTFIGGANPSAKLTYTYQGATNSTNPFGFCINGSSLDQATVQGELGTSPWFIQKIAYQESRFQQFDNKNGPWQPKWGDPQGYGIMQVDPPPQNNDLFDWVTNIADGKTVLAGKQSAASSAWNNSVSKYKQWAKAHNGTPPPPADVAYTYCTFSYSSSPHSFSDANWIKAYNGLGSPAKWFLFWDVSNPMAPFWNSNYECCYVQNVCKWSY